MQEASGTDFTDLNGSAQLPSSIDPATVYRRHTFPRSPLIVANQLYFCRPFAPVVIRSVRSGVVSRNFVRVALGRAGSA
jgi:hypothetical protein